MIADTVLFSRTKGFDEAGQGYFCVVPKRKDRSKDHT